ncbi:hypothetical protein CLCR_02783 [Cladophialophora carrionii]|uniref:Uncharacterized protein n=1 Tax=Cladophialophora carrionii TaxID=86049 RepID=A0A1C1D1T2_9EURO|nr:hypothetical protein CLCR_02783 [Cladophialophora carrionii]
MADALDPVVNVHEGVWTNYSRGKVWGLTWTLCPTHAVIMTNALAILVTVCGVQLFNIIRYTIYRFGTSTRPETPHLQKQQNILKVAVSDMATAQSMLSLAWKHRRSSGKRSIRAYTIGLFAVLYTVLFWVAGIFSNKAISTSSTSGPWEVLSRSKGCGIWNQTYYDQISSLDISTEDNFDMLVQFKSKKGQDVQLSLEYAQKCYFAQSSAPNMSSTCKTFKTPSLSTSCENGTCPFPSYLCHDNSKTAVLDTGYLDSHHDLGINAKPQDRLRYRRVTTCTVINDTNYVTGWNDKVVNTSSAQVSPATAYANFGPSNYKYTNWTYSYSNFASFFDMFSSQVILPYQLDPEMAYAPTDPQYSVSDFEPIEGLAPIKADLVLLFLSYTGMYTTQVDDPWFAAHEEALFEGPYPYLQSRFARDKPISTLGCTEQHDFCTSNGTCTGLGGFDQVQNVAAFNRALTRHQNVTFDRLLRATSLASLQQITMNLGLTTNPLLASNATYTGSSGAVLSAPLPENQWKLELEYWHSIAMAHLQRTAFEWATGQIAPTPQRVQYLVPPQEEPDIWFCNSMILKSAAYQSFNLVAIILIVIFGTLIIIFGLNKENFTVLLSKYPRRPKSEQSWGDDDMLDLGSPWGPRTLPRQHRQHDRSSPDSPSTEPELIKKTQVPSIRRVSSPTLPPEDRTMPKLDRPLGTVDSGIGKEMQRPPRPPRSSWIAISPSRFDGLSPEIPGQVPNNNEVRPTRRPLNGPPPTTLVSDTPPSNRPLSRYLGPWI